MSKDAVTAKTKRRLLRALDYISKEKDRLDMNNWGQFHDGAETFSPVPGWESTIPQQPVPPCGTTCCLAGSVLLTTKAGRQHLKDFGFFSAVKRDQPAIFPNDTSDVAEGLLEIDAQSAHSLFRQQDWRHTYRQMYKKAKTGAGRFRALKLQILYFIKHGYVG